VDLRSETVDRGFAARRDAEIERKVRAVAAQAARLDPLVEDRPLPGPEKALEPAPVRLAVGRGQDQLGEIAAQGGPGFARK